MNVCVCVCLARNWLWFFISSLEQNVNIKFSKNSIYFKYVYSEREAGDRHACARARACLLLPVWNKRICSKWNFSKILW